MRPSEIRHRLVTTLLQAEEPLAGDDLLSRAEVAGEDALPVLGALVADGLVVEGDLLPGTPGPHYRWAARWEEDLRRRASGDRQMLRGEVAAAGAELGLESEPVAAFQEWLLRDYHPPRDKRLLAIFQCSVRRPFSTSPSHASMRRAIWAATGCDPRLDSERCPVHVVVLASALGPVPYELGTVYPANVGGGGVKHLGEPHYQRALPILAGRMAGYLRAHRESYDRIATFTDDRYAEVMAETARLLAGTGPEIRILPEPCGAEVLRIGRSIPRTYWQRFWIQLALEVSSWLPPADQEQMRTRLAKLDVHCQFGSSATILHL